MMETPKRSNLFRSVLGFFVIVVFALQPISNSKSQSNNQVDLVLLLALDVSASVDNREFELVRQGLALALQSDDIIAAITAGKHRAIAIQVMQWSGFQEQEIKISWTKIQSRADVYKLARQIAKMPRRYKGGATDIGGALKASRAMVNAAPFIASRRVIDIAGDGTNNVNVLPTTQRDKTVSQGIIINGLAVIGQAQVLVDYYKRFVIGGPGAFVEEARDYDSFKTAMRRKLLREIDSTQLMSMLQRIEYTKLK